MPRATENTEFLSGIFIHSKSGINGNSSSMYVLLNEFTQSWTKWLHVKIMKSYLLGTGTLGKTE